MPSLAQIRSRRRFAHASKSTRRAWARKAAKTRRLSAHSHVTGLSAKHQSLCKDYAPHGVADTHLSECMDFTSNPPLKNASVEAKAKAIADLIDSVGITEEAERAAGYATRGMKHWEKLAFVERIHELRRKTSSNPELLIHGLSNPQRRVHMRRGRKKYHRRSWRGFIRSHKGIIKRLGLARGIRKIAKMWKRLR